jgi:hypothetical protein
MVELLSEAGLQILQSGRLGIRDLNFVLGAAR